MLRPLFLLYNTVDSILIVQLNQIIQIVQYCLIDLTNKVSRISVLCNCQHIRERAAGTIVEVDKGL